MLDTAVTNGEATRSRHREGPVARAIERQTAKVPSDAFLWAAGGAVASSFLLYAFKRRHASLLVSQLAPVLLILGLYNKIVKISGSDREELHEHASSIVDD